MQFSMHAGGLHVLCVFASASVSDSALLFAQLQAGFASVSRRRRIWTGARRGQNPTTACRLVLSLQLLFAVVTPSFAQNEHRRKLVQKPLAFMM